MAVSTKPVTQSYEIDDWTLEMAQITEGDYNALVELAKGRETLFEGGRPVGVRTDYNIRRLLRLGCYRTMVSCSLEWDDGKQIFTSKDGWIKKAMSEYEFNVEWDKLPPEYGDNIIAKFYETNPTLRGEF